MSRTEYRALPETRKRDIADAYARALAADRFLSFGDYLAAIARADEGDAA